MVLQRSATSNPRSSNVCGFQSAGGSVRSPRTCNGNLLPWPSGLAASKRRALAVRLDEGRDLVDDSWEAFHRSSCVTMWAQFLFRDFDDLLSDEKVKLGTAERN